jgi:hypothetical protein
LTHSPNINATKLLSPVAGLKTTISVKQRWLGIDFSASQQAAQRTWLAEGESERCPSTGKTGALTLLNVAHAQTYFPATLGRDALFLALTAFIAQTGKTEERGKPAQDTFIGLDFSFSLPHALISAKAENWLLWLEQFPNSYPNAEQFRLHCQQASPNKELKRLCDVEAKTPFSPYNLRHYRQTYFGIFAVLRPLVLAQQARVYPFQARATGQPFLAEVCPASVLKRLGLYKPYKGKGEAFRAARAFILQGLQQAFPFRVTGHAWQQQVLNNADGDALDSLIALLALHDNATRLQGKQDTTLDETARLYEGKVLF